MNSTRLWISAAIIAFVILVTFVLSVPHTRNVGEKFIPPAEMVDVPSVALHDTFKKGVHTISGSIEAPNACAKASAYATLTGNASTTQGILVVISVHGDSGICLQLPTQISFQTTISAPASLQLTATVNGAPASMTPS